jgi:AcrR family transcriptional regulator
MPLLTKSSARTDKILQAAGRLFARQGYHGTTTREIAHLAEVSENTIFRHFDHKEDLFWSTLRSHSADLKFSRDLLEGIARCDAPETILPKIIEQLANTVDYRPELLRLVAVAFLELHAKADSYCVEHLSPALSTLNHYLAMNIKSGEIRELDTTMLTSALIMTAIMHSGIYSLIEGNKPSYSTSLDAHRAHSGFWLDLIVTRKTAYPWPVTQVAVENAS